MNEDLKSSVDNLKNSVDRLNKRFGVWWRIILFGMLQGAGVVAGATLLVLFVSWILDILGLFPSIGNNIEGVREQLNEFRPK